MEIVNSAMVKVKEEIEEMDEDKPDFVKIINLDLRQSHQTEEIKEEIKIEYDPINDVANDIANENVPQTNAIQVMCLKCGTLCHDRKSYKLHQCGDRPFKCDQCGRAYKKSSELSYHKKAHTALEKKIIATSTSKLGKRGKVINSQAREIIANVMKFMKAEAERGSHTIPVTNFKARVIAATKISEGSYRNISKESAKIESGEMMTHSSPGKKRARTTIASSLSMIENETIRRIVHNFYIVDKKRPSLKGIYRKLEECGMGFKGGESTLRTVLLKLGFRWKKAEDKGKILFESHDIRLKRIEYLRALSAFRKEDRPIIYLDETYIFSSHTQPTDDTNKIRKPISKGSRLIIMHAGGVMGSVDDALHTFTGGKYGDYHDDITEDIFFKWLTTQVIPNLPLKSVIVLDNASYHNVRLEKELTNDSSKKDMEEWLTDHSIAFEASWTKVELYNLIKAHRQECLYKLDVSLSEHGHSVLRLPPCHPELSAIEQIWATVKNWVGAKNTTFKLRDVENLVHSKFDSIRITEWASICNRVKQLEEEYIQREHLLEQANDETTFLATAGSSDESDSDMDSDLNSDME